MFEDETEMFGGEAAIEDADHLAEEEEDGEELFGDNMEK